MACAKFMQAVVIWFLASWAANCSGENLAIPVDQRLLELSGTANVSRAAMFKSWTTQTRSDFGGHARYLRAHDGALDSWLQVGSDIDGAVSQENFGRAVSMNADGTRVAIGVTRNQNAGYNAGTVRVYDWSGSNWQQVGSDIDSQEASAAFGSSVSLSADGNRLAAGGPFDANWIGHVRVFDWSGSEWQQVGAAIYGEAVEDASGGKVSLSADGTRLAIGSQSNDGAGISAGHVRVYEWSGTAWQQVGSDIDGEAAEDRSSTALSLNADGTRVAIGASYHDDARGQVRVYDWSGSAWQQVGSDIDGDAAHDHAGVCVYLSADGSRLAVGASGHDGVFQGNVVHNVGQVRVYDWSGSAWQQVGADIEGDAEQVNQGFGYSLSLNADGARLAIGAYNKDTSVGGDSGQTRLFDWSGTGWQQVGSDIEAEAAYDNSGKAVFLSADGTRVAIGASSNDGAGDHAGHVRVYEWTGDPPPSPTTPGPTPAPTPPTTASGTGDPHMQNIYGERFDLMKPGKHVLINIPRGMGADDTMLRVQADAVRLGKNCGDLYFQQLNVTGSWAEAKQAGGYHYSVSQSQATSSGWVEFGKVALKIVIARTDRDVQYLNVYAKHLGQSGFAVGGLLGEDDHEEASTPPEACVKRVSLSKGAGAALQTAPIGSVAEADLA